MSRFQKRLWLGLGALALLTPLGIWLPQLVGGGQTWGEWDAEGLKKLVGYVPEGFKRLSELWSAPGAAYGQEGGGGAFLYVISAVVGVAAVCAVLWLIARLVIKNEK